MSPSTPRITPSPATTKYCTKYQSSIASRRRIKRVFHPPPNKPPRPGEQQRVHQPSVMPKTDVIRKYFHKAAASWPRSSLGENRTRRDSILNRIQSKPRRHADTGKQSLRILTQTRARSSVFRHTFDSTALKQSVAVCIVDSQHRVGGLDGSEIVRRFFRDSERTQLCSSSHPAQVSTLNPARMGWDVMCGSIRRYRCRGLRLAFTWGYGR